MNEQADYIRGHRVIFWHNDNPKWHQGWNYKFRHPRHGFVMFSCMGYASHLHAYSAAAKDLANIEDAAQ